MKKLTFTFFALIFSVLLFSNNGYQTEYSRLSSSVSQIEFTLGDFTLRPVNHDGTVFTRIIFPVSVTTMETGFAELPFINANVQLDPVKNIRFEIIDFEYTDHRLEHPLVPSRGVIYRNQDPDRIPYTISPESLVDAFYPDQLADISTPYIIKDVRGTTVYVYPFRYNAVQQTLRVFSSVTVRLVEDDSPPVNPLYGASGKYFREMEALYHSVFINYETTMENLTIGEAGDILVITTSRDEAAIQPYIDWKREKGHGVQKEVVPTGINVSNLIQQKYNANNSILYVQLVGDWADIKSNTGGGASAPMDPMLGCVVGTDNFPDIAIGRFSANNPAQVTVQVNKAINYEKSPMGNWYANAIGIASNEGPGDDGEYDNEHLEVIWNYKLNPFTYNSYTSIYAPNANTTMVKNAIEAGAGIINYTGHGSSNSWGTSGFSNYNINQLTNGSKLPFIFSVACVNGAFHNTSDCFAEAWLKKENGGAVMCLAATINQPWQPPMRGQDYFNDLLTGGYNYATNPGNGISTTEGRSILGSIITNGLVLMYTESAGYQDLITIQTWTTFGDVALQARTQAPEPLALSGTNLIVGMPFETTVTAGGQPSANALVAISQDGNYVSGYTAQDGSVNLSNNFLPGEVLLVVTGFNTQTIYQNIQCIAPLGPYVIFDNVIVNDESGNNNGQLDYGETAGLTVGMKNTGIDPAQDVMVTLTSADAYISIVSAVAGFGNIAPGEVVSITDAFTVQVAGDIPNGHMIAFAVEAAAGGESWQSNFNLTAYAGELAFVDHLIMDVNGNNNGILDPGETAGLTVTLKNTGGAEATGVIATLISSDPFITINQSPQDYGTMMPGAETGRTFSVSASSSTPAGHNAAFSLDVIADQGLTLQESFQMIIGQIPVLIIDMDKNHNSWDKIAAAINELEIAYEKVTAVPTDLDLYASVFLCLGIYPNNHVLTQAQGTQLAAYLNNGGKMYVEGGDTWYYDTQTALQPMFGINAIADGSGDLGTITGQSGTFTEGMTFTYNGENSWIDRLEGAEGGFVVLSNVSPAYGTAVAFDAGTYRTIGASHEFGGLTGDRTALMGAYLDFFELTPPPLIMQTILIPAGWSGLSSCLIPANSDIELVMQPIQNELIILQNTAGIYYPELNINTIGNWNHQQGYQIKVESPVELTVSGWHNAQQQLDLNPGWNLIPVMSDCDTDIELLFDGSIEHLQIIKEIAGPGIFWPEMNINTLGILKPGCAYYVRMYNQVTIFFPNCP